MDPSTYKSPKRKRDIYEDSTVSFETSGFTRHFTRRASDAESIGGDQSPRTSVAGKFQKLELRNITNSRIPFRETKPDARKEVDDSFTYNSDGTNMELHQPHQEGIFTFKAGQSSPMNISQPASEQTTPSSSQTKQLNVSISQQTREHKGSAPSDTPSPPHRTNKSPPPPKSKRPRSPPPLRPSSSSSSTEPESEFWWSSSEITGWDPNDPDEDNYGVNGVGYQKTAAAAYSLSQKRKQQIAEYRSREAREARQRRSESRRSGFRIGGSRRGSPTAATVVSGPNSRPGSSSVMMTEESISRSDHGMGVGNVTGGGNVRCVRFEVG